MIGWTATLPFGVPLVGTFHSYSTKRVPNALANVFGATQVLNRLRVRIAVSEAAAWTGRRWFGGRYRVIPNGVNLDEGALDEALAATSHEGDTLRILFVGQAVERKGLPLLLRAFEALREHIPTELTVIGPTEAELAPLLMDPRGVRALGKVDDATKHAELLAADVLAAPSLGGESFGMVLTEAFASGATVVASDIAGYRDVVEDGVDGVLVAPGDAQALAETLRELYHEPERRRELAYTAAAAVKRFAWERVALEVMEAYTDAIAMPEPKGAAQTLRGPRRLHPGRPAAARARAAAREPRAAADRHREPAQRALAGATRGDGARQPGRNRARLPGAAEDRDRQHRQDTDQLRAVLRAARARDDVRGDGDARLLLARDPQGGAAEGAGSSSRDAIRGTMIGVLMSSTLPARLGEPSRALIVARRTGRPRENTAGRAGHGRLADRAQRRRAGRSSA